MNTPDGPGVTLHPVVPGHPEKAWWILFGRFAKKLELSEISEPRMSVDEDEHRGCTRTGAGPGVGGK